MAKGEAVDDNGFRLIGADEFARLWERAALGLGSDLVGNEGRGGKASVWSNVRIGSSGGGAGRGG